MVAVKRADRPRVSQVVRPQVVGDLGGDGGQELLLFNSGRALVNVVPLAYLPPRFALVFHSASPQPVRISREPYRNAGEAKA
jgi:hypothetical protein